MPPASRPEADLVRKALRGLAGPVTLDYYTPDVESLAARAERELLETIAGASERITLRVHAGRWDAARETEVGIRRTPAIALAGARDTGIRYYGAPDGYELEVFLGLLLAVAEGRSGLGAGSVADLRCLERPLHLEVLASPT